jgi:uncharacterized protein (TIGR00297 family)
MTLPFPDLTVALAVTIFCTAMAILSYTKKVFNLSGSISAFVVGMVIGIFGDVLWLFLLMVFLIVSFGATKYRFEWKKSEGFQEGKKGERSWKNVFANGAIPTAIALLSFVVEALDPSGDIFTKDIATFLFVSAIAVAASDTAASEIGIVDPRVYMITTLKRVPRGVDGGVSLTGTFAAFIAAAFTSVIAYVLFATFNTDLLAGPATLFIPMLCGFLGCQIDSVIGATYETRGKIGKLGNNFVSILTGTLIALALAWI